MTLHELLCCTHLDARVRIVADGTVRTTECAKAFKGPVWSADEGLAEPFDRLANRGVKVIDAIVSEDAEGNPVPEIEVSLENQEDFDEA